MERLTLATTRGQREFRRPESGWECFTLIVRGWWPFYLGGWWSKN